MDMWSLGMLLFRLVKNNDSLWSCLGLNSDEEIIQSVISKTTDQLQLEVHAVLDQQLPLARDAALKRVLKDLLMVNPSSRPSCRDVKNRGLVTGDISFSPSKIYNEIQGVKLQVDDQQVQINDVTDGVSEVKQILVVERNSQKK
jgi:serine/threonine protein kinase